MEEPQMDIGEEYAGRKILSKGMLCALEVPNLKEQRQMTQ